MEEGEMRLFLIDQVSPCRDRAAGLVLLVDEAQFLSLRLLDEIRMLSNLVREGQPRVHVVLAGNPLLEERFTLPKLTAFNQRVAARCYLSALSREETSRYVRSQIEWSGGTPDELFTHDAIGAIYNATDGVPRLINQVCDHALIMASAGGKQLIGEEGIEEAWADLQQLPAPFVNSRTSIASTGGDFIEFGTLIDEQADDLAADGADIARVDAPALMDSDFPDDSIDSVDSTEEASTVPVKPLWDESAEVVQLSAVASDETGEMFVFTNPERQLDEIEDKVFRVTNEHDDVFLGESADGVEPDWSSDESVLTGRHDATDDLWQDDPFSEPFEEEEAVIDHLASLPSARPVTNTYLQNENETYDLPLLPLPIAHALASDSPVITEDLLPKATVLASDDDDSLEETVVAGARKAEYQKHDATAAHAGDRRMDDQDATNPNAYDASVAGEDDRSCNPDTSDAAHREPRKEFRQLFARLRQQ
jgi:hypothetical protein